MSCRHSGSYSFVKHVKHILLSQHSSKIPRRTPAENNALNLITGNSFQLLTVTASADKTSAYVIIKISLDQNDRRTLVAGTAGQVAQRTDQIGQLSRCRTLRYHIAYQIVLLLADAVGDRFLKRFAGQVLEIVVRQIFQLQLVGRALQAGCAGR